MSNPVDLIKDHNPVDNDEKPMFIGDFIVNLKPIRMIQGKKDPTKQWIIIEGDVIRVVSTKEGNQAVCGSEFFRMYDGSDADGMQRFDNDCKTIGIEIDKSSQEAFEVSFANSENKKAYVRGWTYEKKDGSGKAQSFAVKSKKLITPELETAEIPF